MLEDTLNDDYSYTTGINACNLAHAASAHYMIHSNIKYWESANISWNLTNSSTFYFIFCI